MNDVLCIAGLKLVCMDHTNFKTYSKILLKNLGKFLKQMMILRENYKIIVLSYIHRYIYMSFKV